MKEFKKLIRNVSILLLTLLLLMFLNAKVLAGSSGIKINEVMFDPVGDDLGNEWIELYNPSDVEIVVNNWKFQAAGTHFLDAATISGTISAKSYYLVCEMKLTGCDLNVAKLGFQNGGGATDGIQLLDNTGNVIDQVFYDTPNVNNLVGQDGSIVDGNMTALIGRSGESLGRTDFIDTDNSSSDFLIYSSPTPDSENIVSTTDGSLPQTGQNPIWLVIIAFSIIFLILIKSVILFNIINLKVFVNDKIKKQKGPS